MTGYGRASGRYAEKSIAVEVRAVNAKITDLKLRLPGDYKEREIELRKLITDHADRGKLDVLVEVQNADGTASVTLNEALFRGYHRELSRLTQELNLPQTDLLQAILRIPNVVATPTGDIDENEWAAICNTVTQALDNFKNFRMEEGKALEVDLRHRVKNIISLLEQTRPFEQERFVKMRERMRSNMEENFGKENLDKNRFEQEILYYLEKLDCTEERVRLEQHCKYFQEHLDNRQESVGRPLGFISQEMGREINTLGAKAYDADIQRLVVQMKDELEKIKEQLANVL
ncbi:MAG: YicC family protein [Saprospiraceae bacterium]|nr:YicC family protein [Saprospiraceae bacterium]